MSEGFATKAKIKAWTKLWSQNFYCAFCTGRLEEEEKVQMCKNCNFV